MSEKLKPFFCYYGGKWRDAIKNYPIPEHNTIIEPFAGSAGFSLRYADRKIFLCDLDPLIISLWKYLISCSANEILSLPDLSEGQSVDDLKLPQEAKWLIGFWLNKGTSTPRKTPSKWMRLGIPPKSYWGIYIRQRIATQVKYIRHWKIYQGSYEECPFSEKEATWFIDPPYQVAGKHYRYNSSSIDYSALGNWCRKRKGQVIVCENKGATWLPFTEVADVKTSHPKRRSQEVIWTNRSQKIENYSLF